MCLLVLCMRYRVKIDADAVFLTDLPARDACCDHLREHISRKCGEDLGNRSPAARARLLASPVAWDLKRGERYIHEAWGGTGIDRAEDV